MATIVHFDISAENPSRAKNFYENLFGWKFETLPGPESYYLIETKNLEGKTGVGGGLAKRDDSQQPGITNFVEVASVDESIKKVVELGGVIVQPKHALTGWGFIAVCKDTENNLFGLFSTQ